MSFCDHCSACAPCKRIRQLGTFHSFCRIMVSVIYTTSTFSRDKYKIGSKFSPILSNVSQGVKLHYILVTSYILCGKSKFHRVSVKRIGSHLKTSHGICNSKTLSFTQLIGLCEFFSFSLVKISGIWKLKSAYFQEDIPWNDWLLDQYNTVFQ